jgi:hypothetical protein
VVVETIEVRDGVGALACSMARYDVLYFGEVEETNCLKFFHILSKLKFVKTLSNNVQTDTNPGDF